MKRSASTAGLTESGAAEGERAAGAANEGGKSGGGGGSDVGGSSAPPSPASHGNASPEVSESGAVGAEKSSEFHSNPSGNGGKSASAGKRGGGGAPLRVLPASPLGSDDEEEGKSRGGLGEKGGNEDDEEEEERMENLELGKYNTVDPDRMQQVLNRFTAEQMSRYECYRRSGFQRANMRRLLASVAGCPISIPMTIVMSGISKMFVGELVEVGRIVMTERNDVGPIRPCHIREAYRRLKLDGKVPVRGRSRLFR